MVNIEPLQKKGVCFTDFERINFNSLYKQFFLNKKKNIQNKLIIHKNGKTHLRDLKEKLKFDSKIIFDKSKERGETGHQLLKKKIFTTTTYIRT